MPLNKETKPNQTLGKIHVTLNDAYLFIFEGRLMNKGNLSIYLSIYLRWLLNE